MNETEKNWRPKTKQKAKRRTFKTENGKRKRENGMTNNELNVRHSPSLAEKTRQK